MKKDGGCDMGGTVGDGSDAEEVGYYRVNGGGFLECPGYSGGVVAPCGWGTPGGGEGDEVERGLLQDQRRKLEV